MTRQLEVAEVIDETDDARTLVLRVPSELAAEFAYRPGQFLTVRVPAPDTGPDGAGRDGSVARCYSLSSSPDTDDLPRITVKRVPGGHASNWICDHVRPGSTLHVLPPAGRFTPRGLDQDVLLVAGGSGITPVLSILKTVLARGRGRASLVYANRDEAGVIFGQELKALQARHPARLHVALWLDSVQGPPTADGLRAAVADLVPGAGAAGPDAFVCGPALFMDVATDAVRQLGVPARRIHVERFESLTNNPFIEPPADARAGTAADTLAQPGADAPAGPPADAAARPGADASDDAPLGAHAGPPADADHRTGAEDAAGPRADADRDTAPGAATASRASVAVTRNGRVSRLAWPAGARLLDVLIAGGLNPPYSCREGRCGACACRITSGEVELVHNEVLEEEDFAENYILACQALARSDEVEITYD